MTSTIVVPRLAVERLEQLDDVRAGLAVEVARRLVGEEQARRVAERARDGDALLLAAGELVRESGARRSPSPTRASSSRARAGAPSSPRSSSGTCTFSSAVSVGIS